MLTHNTISAVKDVPISTIIGATVQLKKAGSNLQGCCPFHSEKTPSFVVSDTKGIYKCFGCGRSGDGIKFIMENENKDFLQAVETIANNAGIAIEYENDFDTAEYQAKKEARKSMGEVLNLVIEKYKANLLALPDQDPVRLYLANRGISHDTIIEWQLGWAPADWRFITPELISTGHHDHAAAMGIIKRGQSDDNNYDGYRSRIIIPISNAYGQNIGMGGRYLQVDAGGAGEGYPK